MPDYQRVRPYDITRDVRQSKKDIDQLKRTAKGSQQYSYTPVWSTTGTAPALGNGTLVGTYTRVGVLVHYRIILTYGSTSTGGSGAWSFSVPFPADLSIADWIGSAMAYDASASQGIGGVSWLNNFSGTDANGVVQAYFGTLTSRMTTTIPIAGGWASGDIVRLTGWYVADEENVVIP